MEILFFAALTAAGSGPSGASGEARKELPPPADSAGGGSFTWGTYDGPEGSRRYKLFVPEKSAGARRLLVMLHGCTQDPEDFARGTRMNAVAGAHGFLVLYPEQPASANPLKCWNWFASAHQRRDAGEPAILASLIRKVAGENNVDWSQIHLAGISAGAAMGAILGATYPELFAGMALHSGIAYALATDASQALVAMRAPAGDTSALAGAVVEQMGERIKAIPVLVIQGSTDASVNPANAELLAAQWRAVNERAGGNGAAPVELRMIEGLGHAWSGGSKEGTFTDETGPDISRAIVEFLLSAR